MTIQESLNRLVDILKSADADDLKDNYPHIAEALEIDTESVDVEDTDAIVESIKAAVEIVEEDDVEAVVEEIGNFFSDEDLTEGSYKKKTKKEESDEDDDDDDDDEKDDDEEMDEEDAAEYGKKKQKEKMKGNPPTRKSAKESFFISASDLDVSEDVGAIFHGEELTEEFQEKAKTIFESAVVTKVNEKVATIAEEYDDLLEEKTQEIEEAYSEKLDEYLDYVISEWAEENKIALESGIRQDMMESFIDSMKTVFEEHYMELPEEKVDLVDDLQNKIEELEGGLNEALEQNSKLNRQLKESKKEEVIDELSEELSDYQKEKLRGLLEGIEVEEDDDEFEAYRKKASIVKENYFPTETESLTEDNRYEEPLEEEEDKNSPVGRYASALSRFSGM